MLCTEILLLATVLIMALMAGDDCVGDTQVPLVVVRITEVPAISAEIVWLMALRCFCDMHPYA